MIKFRKQYTIRLDPIRGSSTFNTFYLDIDIFKIKKSIKLFRIWDR